MQRVGLQVTRIKTDERPASIEVGTAVLDSIGRLPTVTRNGVPMTIATLSSSGLTQVTRTFRDTNSRALLAVLCERGIIVGVD